MSKKLELLSVTQEIGSSIPSQEYSFYILGGFVLRYFFFSVSQWSQEAHTGYNR